MSVDDIVMYLRKSRTDDPALTVQEVLSKHEQMLDDWVVRNIPGGGRKVPEANRYCGGGNPPGARPCWLLSLSVSAVATWKTLAVW